MKVIEEINKGTDFNFWSGAVETNKYLTNEEINIVFNYLEECYPEGMTDVEINNFYWFQDDEIASILGYGNFEEIMNR